MPFASEETVPEERVLYCTVLYCIVLYCTVLYCTVLQRVLWDFWGVSTTGLDRLYPCNSPSPTQIRNAPITLKACTGVREIGCICSSRIEGVGSFGKGTTSALFQICGTKPSIRLVLKIPQTGPYRPFAYSAIYYVTLSAQEWMGIPGWKAIVSVLEQFPEPLWRQNCRVCSPGSGFTTGTNRSRSDNEGICFFSFISMNYAVVGCQVVLVFRPNKSRKKTYGCPFFVKRERAHPMQSNAIFEGG